MHHAAARALAVRPVAPVAAPSPPATTAAPARKKLGFKEQRELEQLPARIEQLEADVAARTAALQDAAFYRQEPAAQQRANAELAAVQASGCPLVQGFLLAVPSPPEALTEMLLSGSVTLPGAVPSGR